MQLLSRRVFLQFAGWSAAALSSGLSIAPRILLADGDADLLDHDALHTLSRMARDIFPHHDIAPGLYDKVALAINAKPAADHKLVQEGLAGLNALAGAGGWSTLDDATRQGILKKIETTPFFQLVRSAAVEVVYRDTGVWQLLGYGGSSIEHGGYLNRGFNDLDWLPRTE